MEKSFLKTFNDAFGQIIVFLPDLFAALAILLLGAIAAAVVKKLTLRLGLLIRLDRLAARLFAKGDVRHTFLNLLGNVLGVIVFLVFLDSALLVLRLQALEKMVQKTVFFIPNLIISGVILGIGLLVANRVAHSTEQLFSGEGLRHAYALSRFIRGRHPVVRDRVGAPPAGNLPGNRPVRFHHHAGFGGVVVRPGHRDRLTGCGEEAVGHAVGATGKVDGKTAGGHCSHPS